MKQLSAKTFWARIYVAGDIEVAKHVCREACFREGLCVTVEPCEYIYTGGQETGYVVGLINYPRFPAGGEEISDRAKRLATELMDRGFQNSALVMTPEDTEWITRRPESADAGRDDRPRYDTEEITVGASTAHEISDIRPKAN